MLQQIEAGKVNSTRRTRYWPHGTATIVSEEGPLGKVVMPAIGLSTPVVGSMANAEMPLGAV
jgi:hypothetical protein